MTTPVVAKKKAQRSFCTWLQINGDWYKVGFSESKRVQLTKYYQRGSGDSATDQNALIESQYWVCLNPVWCECPDFIKHEGTKKCKHIACLEKLCEALGVSRQGPQELQDTQPTEKEEDLPL